MVLDSIIIHMYLFLIHNTVSIYLANEDFL
nr:MAG TPA: hypothetical protein [Caudoviricetes sp.]